MSVVDELAPERVASIRRQNDARFKGWSADRVIRLHRRTVRDTSDPESYLEGMRRHLADGTYRRLYPPHVVEASRAFLAQQAARHAAR